MEIRSNFVGDLKLPLPHKFTGKYEDFEEWSWTLKTYMSMLDTSLAPLMDKLEDMPLVITDEDLKVENDDAATKARVTFSRKLHYLLAMLTEDSARLLVRQNASGNGFETWRLLSQKFTLPGTIRNVGLLSQLLSYTFTETDFQTDFDRWEDLK